VVAGFKAYEMEDDVIKDVAEISLAQVIYAPLVQAHVCEQSARYGSIRIMMAILCSVRLCGLPMTAGTPWTMHQRTQRT
jgi:hypothetical protein